MGLHGWGWSNPESTKANEGASVASTRKKIGSHYMQSYELQTKVRLGGPIGEYMGFLGGT